MTTSGPPPSMARSRFVTAVARSFILLSAGILLSLVLLQLVGRPDTSATTSALAKRSTLFAFYASHMRLFRVANFALWVLMLASAVSLLNRRNWARLSFSAILGFEILYSILGLIFFPWSSFASVGISLSTIRIVVAIVSIVFIGLLGWILVKLLSPSIRAEFFP